jgi:hypothetical protein
MGVDHGTGLQNSSGWSFLSSVTSMRPGGKIGRGSSKCSECVGIEKIDDFGFVLPKLAFATIYSCNGLNYCNYRTRRAEAWRAVLDLVDRGLRRPAFLIVDGASGLSVHFKTAVLLLRETTMCSSIFSLTSRLAIRLRSTSRAFCQMSVE